MHFAAKLNVLAGCPSCPIAHTIIDADQWMGAHPKDIKASSEAWPDEAYFECGSIPSGEYLYKKLDAYNNGQL